MLSLEHSEQPTGLSKQSPIENSPDYTNDDYGGNDSPAVGMVITVCCTGKKKRHVTPYNQRHHPKGNIPIHIISSY